MKGACQIFSFQVDDFSLKLDDSPKIMDSLDVECSICLSILIKPVGPLPCLHEFCLDCFQQHMSKSTEIFCPICRRCITSFASRAKAKGRLVNEARWEFIQKRFSKRVERRLNNLDSDSEDEEVTETSKLNVTADLTVGEDREVEEEAIKTVPATSTTTSEELKRTEKRSKGNITNEAGGATRRGTENCDTPMKKQQQEANDYRYAFELHIKLNKNLVASEQSAAVVGNIETVPTTSEELKRTETGRKRKIIDEAGSGTTRRSSEDCDTPMKKQQQETNDYRYALKLYMKLNKNVVASERSAAVVRNIETVPTTSEEHKRTETGRKRKIIDEAESGATRRTSADCDTPMKKQQQETNDYRYAFELHIKLNKNVDASKQSAAVVRSTKSSTYGKLNQK